jgi:hypothetical protein
MSRIFTLLLIFISSAGCLSQKQGISGRVLWIEGNQMPGPDRKKTAPKPIERELQIYEPVKLSETKRVNGFYTEIAANPVVTVKSSTNGTFHVALPPGKYSVFVKEPDGLFANLLDGDGYINVIEVKTHKFTEIIIEVNYKAAF